MKKVLIAVDGSNSSKKAFEYALEEAATLGNKITILRVVQSLPYGGETIKEIYEDEISKAQKVTEKLKERANEEGVEADSEVATGPDVANEIIRFANEGDYDLIVVGSRGKTELETVTLGSVSESVIKRSHVPVLVVR